MSVYLVSGYLAGMIVFVLHFRRINPLKRMSALVVTQLLLLSLLFPFIYLFAGAVRIIDWIHNTQGI